MSDNSGARERAAYERVRRVTRWSLMVGVIIAGTGALNGFAVSSLAETLSPVKVISGVVCLVVFVVLYLRITRIAMTRRTPWREIAAAGAVSVVALLIQDPTPWGWGLMAAAWAGVAALNVTTAQAVLITLGTTAAAAALTASDKGMVPAALQLLLVIVVTTWGNRFQVWFWYVLADAIAGKEAQTRLAVTEERLRFSRDLHDLVGHSLSAIAVKSEVALKLAHADLDRAVAEMGEVRHLAKESLHEIRTAVRGYRTVDLPAELSSVRAVLVAAGIRCEVRAPAESALPGQVSTLLAWVVREGTTNVLRHSSATFCRIDVEPDGGRVRLRMTNDGVRPVAGERPGEDRPAGDGSGLAGLADRVAAHGGTLCAGPGKPGEYALTATVPVRGVE
ncbi:sensor histidine kinase [Spongiactinospora sp. 9N601]|uniref:sensor histidine kinase n=1 Tax=Spongiactinospora sp. 9N601 TaxID=3375149 RepID=UPI0037A6973C